MFKRPEQNYAVEDIVINGILNDESQPLCQIVKILPDSATVLDIGAGSGVLGRVLIRADKRVIIDGVEPNIFAVELAKPFYRNIYTGYAQDHLKVIKENYYDYVVLADVIEHIPDPAEFLTQLIAVLPNTTKLIISIPNIAFGGVRLALMNGIFNYVDSGLLERTHMRFFTITTARQLFELLQLSLERIVYLERSFYRVEFSRKHLAASPFKILMLANKADARAYQYLFVLGLKPSNTTIIENRGTSAMRIIFDALVAWPAVIRMVRKWRGH